LKKNPLAGPILDHLVGRRVLSTAEQNWLDLDGDGRITTRDLLLSRLEVKPTTLGAVVPETRIVRAGDTLRCQLLGECPEKLRATVTLRGKKVELAVDVRREGKQCRLAIDLPGTLLRGAHQRLLSILVVAPGVIPRSVLVTLTEPAEPA
jgi:hypothetical protein